MVQEKTKMPMIAHAEYVTDRGSVLVAQPANNCAWCDGKGVDRIESDKTCRACNGSGWSHSHIDEL